MAVPTIVQHRDYHQAVQTHLRLGNILFYIVPQA